MDEKGRPRASTGSATSSERFLRHNAVAPARCVSCGRTNTLISATR